MRLAIASGKGGTGKTTLAVNLAKHLSVRQDALLVDLDVEEPNGAIFIQGDETGLSEVKRWVPDWDQQKCTLCGKCTNWCRYNALLRLGDTILVLPELCHSCHACSELCPQSALPMRDLPLGKMRTLRSGKLDFVESRLEIGVEQASPLISRTLKHIDERFSSKALQILDCPPGTSCAMVSATRTADFAILVTEPTPFGLYDLSLAVDTLRHLKVPFAVVVNRSGDHDLELQNYCATERIPIWTSIPERREIAGLYSEGRLLFDTVPEVMTALAEIEAQLERLS